MIAKYMLFYGRIVTPFDSLSNKSRNSKVFTHIDFKIALSFAIIGSILATTHNFKQCENVRKQILCLNVKQLINLHLVWNRIRSLQCGRLFLIMQLILVLIWSKGLPEHGCIIMHQPILWYLSFVVLGLFHHKLMQLCLLP